MVAGGHGSSLEDSTWADYNPVAAPGSSDSIAPIGSLKRRQLLESPQTFRSRPYVDGDFPGQDPRLRDAACDPALYPARTPRPRPGPDPAAARLHPGADRRADAHLGQTRRP